MWGRAWRRVTGWRPVAVAALVTLVIAGLGVLRVWPPLAVVMSGSMAPTINTGDMVVLQHLRAPAHVGEVVAVPVPDSVRARYGYPPVVIHRVVRIAGGQIRTKGDAWPSVDPFTVPRTAVDARVIADIPAGGRVLAFFHSAPGLLWLLCGGLLFFGRPLFDRVRDARHRGTETAAEVRGELETLTTSVAEVHAEQERSRRSTAEIFSQLDRLTLLVERALADGAVCAAADQALGSDVAPAGCLAVESASYTSAQEDRRRLERDMSPICAIPVAAAAVAPGEDNDRAAVTVVAAAAIMRPVLRPTPTAVKESALAGRRWDAPPLFTSPSAAGWAAPPAVGSGRFRRPGRLVAASVAHARATA